MWRQQVGIRFTILKYAAGCSLFLDVSVGWNCIVSICEGRWKTSWTGGSAPLLRRGRR
jgi:hypothetical protein